MEGTQSLRRESSWALAKLCTPRGQDWLVKRSSREMGSEKPQGFGVFFRPLSAPMRTSAYVLRDTGMFEQRGGMICLTF